MNTRSRIILYQFEDCPYCAKVRAFLRELKLPFTTIDVSYDRENSIRKELREKSGVPTVPVILIDGQYVGDSHKIIRFLEEKFRGGQKYSSEKKD